MYLGLFAHDGSSSEHIGEAHFANRTLGCFPGTPQSEYLGAATNVVWAAVHNQFFATIALPRDRSTRVFARHIDLPASAIPGAVAGSAHVGYQAALLYAAEDLPPQQERVREFDLYVGPKDYNTVAGLGNNADVVMGFDNYFGGRFSGFFARGLLLAMNGLHTLGLSYAMAIISITVIVRLLFWPLMAASARTSKRMAALQPQIKELQERYKDNPQRMNQKMLELWRGVFADKLQRWPEGVRGPLIARHVERWRAGFFEGQKTEALVYEPLRRAGGLPDVPLIVLSAMGIDASPTASLPEGMQRGVNGAKQAVNRLLAGSVPRGEERELDGATHVWMHIEREDSVVAALVDLIGRICA